MNNYVWRAMNELETEERAEYYMEVRTEDVAIRSMTSTRPPDFTCLNY